MEENKPIRRRRRETSTSKSEPIEIDWGMKITVHRGTEQIGGCVTEYEHCGWRLFVDYGEQLPGALHTEPLQIEGLNQGDISKSALLITHYHGDHIGRIIELPEALPIYMSEMGRNIQKEASQHLSYAVENHKLLLERLKMMKTFRPGQQFSFGPFDIIPIMVDHSAFDASAFKITADGVSVFHTGDFRTHGFRSKTLPKVLTYLVGHVDYVVCEGTNIGRKDATSQSEQELQRELQTLFRKHKHNIVYVSSTNIDRLFALYHVAQKLDKPFIVSKYQKQVMDCVAGRDPIWGKSTMYQYNEKYKILKLDRLDKNKDFVINDKFQYLLDTKGSVVVVQANDRFDHFIAEHLKGDTQKYLSMWDGYLKEGTDAYNPRLAQSLGKGYLYKHTSGHCDIQKMHEIFELLQPSAIIPIHTDNPDEFAKLFCDEWPVIRLYDGQSISPISTSTADSCSASIFCTKELEDGFVYENREDWEEAHSLDVKYIGFFKTIEDSMFALEHTLYRPAAIVGYEIEEKEDLSPFMIHTYDANKNLLATYTYGGHQPVGAKYHETCRIASEVKALAVFHAPYYAVVPVKVIGAITPDSERGHWEKNEFYDTYEDYVKDWDDWHWDSVVVHPLVKLKSEYEQMTDTEIVPRVHLFPYGNTDEWGVTYSDNGKTLRHIDSESFACEEYTIPEGVEVIDFPFMCVEHKHLRKINLPNTLRHMVDNTFIDCLLEELLLPEGMTEIPGCMCENCRELKRVVLPSTLKKIGDAAFCNCIKLEEIVLPNGLEVIRDDAFGNCVSLKHLELPASLKYIGSDTFLGSGVDYLSKFEHKDEDLTSDYSSFA